MFDKGEKGERPVKVQGFRSSDAAKLLFRDLGV